MPPLPLIPEGEFPPEVDLRLGHIRSDASLHLQVSVRTADGRYYARRYVAPATPQGAEDAFSRAKRAAARTLAAEVG